jgi:hypothetical protein
VVSDGVSFPGVPEWNVSSVYFGEIESDNVPGDFVIPPESGIMGFAFESLSAWQQPCVFSQMGIYQSFSTCLTVAPPPVFEMGTNYRATQKAAFNWTTMYSDPGWLSVWLSDAGIAGKTLGISASSLNSQSVIIDTGTTFIICSTEMMTVCPPLVNLTVSNLVFLDLHGAPERHVRAGRESGGRVQPDGGQQHSGRQLLQHDHPGRCALPLDVFYSVEQRQQGGGVALCAAF